MNNILFNDIKKIGPGMDIDTGMAMVLLNERMMVIIQTRQGHNLKLGI